MRASWATIQAAAMSVPWWRPQAYYDEPGRGTRARDGGGLLITQAIHTLDLFRWCVGVSRVEAAQVAHDRAASHGNRGLRGRLGASRQRRAGHHHGHRRGVSRQRRSGCTIIGQRGTAWLTGGNLRVAWLDGREESLADDSGSGSGTNLMGFSHEPHKAVLVDFLDAVEAGRDPAIPGEEALATQRVIEDILAAGGAR